MNLVIHPPVDDARLTIIREAARPLSVVKAVTAAEAIAAMPDAAAVFGKGTPEMLAVARK